jgi:hypothetical protein
MHCSGVPIRNSAERGASRAGTPSIWPISRALASAAAAESASITEDRVTDRYRLGIAAQARRFGAPEVGAGTKYRISHLAHCFESDRRRFAGIHGDIRDVRVLSHQAERAASGTAEKDRGMRLLERLGPQNGVFHR